MDTLERTFDTVLDCGLFPTFDSDEWSDYVASLASATRQDELNESFGTGRGLASRGRRSGPTSDEIPRRPRRAGAVRDGHTGLTGGDQPF